jgi:hypothetical protein
MMQNNGIRSDQITQVRGFADLRLRKPEAPLDPSNRRISLMVEYLDKKTEPPRSRKRRRGNSERRRGQACGLER